jgi:anti-sigma factor RsiW
VSRNDRHFARFYYDDFLREFPEVYADDAAFAAWMRLLVRAEKDWPTIPELPRSIRPRALRALVGAGLVILSDPHCYRIRGLDAERTRRQGAGRKGAAVRWDSERNANASAVAVPRRDETRRDEVTPPPPAAPVGRRKNGTNPRVTGENPRANGTSPRQVREARKRGPSSLHEILRRAAEA